jgi:hypothetical protein
MTVGNYTFGLGSLIALAVAIVAFIFLVTGTPAHVFTWIFGLILALAVARLIP